MADGRIYGLPAFYDPTRGTWRAVRRCLMCAREYGREVEKGPPAETCGEHCAAKLAAARRRPVYFRKVRA